MKHATRRDRTQRGFTLVELMTVIAIIAVLVALATIAMKPGVGTPERTSDNIVGMIGFARLRAISTGVRHRVQVDNTTVSAWVGVDGANVPKPGFQAPIAYLMLQAIAVPTGVVVWNAQTAVDSAGSATPLQNAALSFVIDFFPDGSSTGGTIFLTDTQTLTKERIFVYSVTGSAHQRENW